MNVYVDYIAAIEYQMHANVSIGRVTKLRTCP